MKIKNKNSGEICDCVKFPALTVGMAQFELPNSYKNTANLELAIDITDKFHYAYIWKNMNGSGSNFTFSSGYIVGFPDDEFEFYDSKSYLEIDFIIENDIVIEIENIFDDIKNNLEKVKADLIKKYSV